MSSRYLILCTLLMPAIAAAGESDVRATVERLAPGTPIERLSPSALPHFFDVVIGGDLVFVSEDGRYIVQGPVFDTVEKADLAEVSLAPLRAASLARVEETDLITFRPDQVTHRIFVFTDTECGYCRKLHAHMDALLAKGIEVNYLLFPRAGVGSTSYDTAVSVYCSDSRQRVLTDAKAGKSVPTSTCVNPVADFLDLGRSMGVTGTPAIYTESGRQLGGYLEPEKLLARLQTLEPSRARE